MTRDHQRSIEDIAWRFVREENIAPEEWEILKTDEDVICFNRAITKFAIGR